MDKEYASKSAYMQPVGMKTLVVGHPFTLPSANPIDSLLDNQPYSAHAIQTIDTIAFADSNEFMRSYVLNNIEAYRLFIQLMGQHFQRSPAQRKTELPLMILTQTESIFTRRIRRLKHLQKESFSSRVSSGSDISFSKSYVPNNNSGRYLQSRLSQKSLSQITQFKYSKCAPVHDHDIYCPSSDEDPEHQLNFIRKKSEGQFNQWLALSGIRRLGPIEERDEALIDAIRQPREEDMIHLIVGNQTTSNVSQSERNKFDRNLDQENYSAPKRISGCSQNEPVVFQERVKEHLVSPLGYLIGKDIPLKLKKEVYRELSRYSWEGLSAGPLQSSPRRRVKDKAIDLLYEIGHFQGLII